jgi:hypothetical protein
MELKLELAVSQKELLTCFRRRDYARDREIKLLRREHGTLRRKSS